MNNNLYERICKQKLFLATFFNKIDWLIGASLSSYHEKATVRYVLDESAPA